MTEPSMCGFAPVIPLAKEKDALAKLKTYSSAEDFFTGLGVKYDPKRLDVARMHILKRMGEYMGGDDLEGLPNSVVIARCRSYLERAYQDFVTSSPLEERVFKVLKNATEPKEEASSSTFVPLEDFKF